MDRNEDTTGQQGIQEESLDASAGASASPAGSEYVEMDPEALFPVGSLVEYKEDNAILFCKVLENTCDKAWLRYKLEVVQEYCPHFIGGHAKPGDVFDPCQNREYSFSGMWHILPLGTYTREKDWPVIPAPEAVNPSPSTMGEK